MSVEAIHERLICVLLAAVADKLAGAVGGVVSASVAVLATLE